MKKLIFKSKSKEREEQPKAEVVKMDTPRKKKAVEDSKKEASKILDLFWDGYSDLGYC